jgi:uncharacterized protein (DUF1015 family)
MPDIKPFAGVRYSNAEGLGRLVCPPYDIISPEEQANLYERDPHNAVRLELPLSKAPDESKEERYRRAASDFREWLEAGVLKKDDEESLYVYRQDFVTPSGKRSAVTGVIAALRLERFGTDSGVLPHERTMPGPIEDRLALMHACPVNISPIYGIYRGGGRLAPFFESLQHRPTAGRFSDGHGSLHRLWVISAPAEIDMLVSSNSDSPLVIADGHHRYETALAYHEERSGPGGHDSIMCFCVDADAGDLEVLPYNRAFTAQVSQDELQSALAARFSTKTFPAGEGFEALQASDADHPLLFVLPGSDLLVEVSADEVAARLGDRAQAWRSLDVVALHEVVLAEALPAGTDKVVFSHDPDEVLALVRSGDWTAGVVLRPLKAAEVIDVATSGERMPQKASYFWPKAITGLTFRELD